MTAEHQTLLKHKDLLREKLSILRAGSKDGEVGVQDDSWMDGFEQIIEALLSEIPEVGSVLSFGFSFIFSLFNQGPDIGQVLHNLYETIMTDVDEKIKDAVFALLKGQLDGVQGILEQYNNALKNWNDDPTNEALRTQLLIEYDNAKDSMIGSLPEFLNADVNNDNGEKQNYYAPMAGIIYAMLATHLRDGIYTGSGWGLDDKTWDSLWARLVTTHNGNQWAQVAGDRARTMATAKACAGMLYGRWMIQGFDMKKSINFSPNDKGNYDFSSSDVNVIPLSGAAWNYEARTNTLTGVSPSLYMNTLGFRCVNSKFKYSSSSDWGYTLDPNGGYTFSSLSLTGWGDDLDCTIQLCSSSSFDGTVKILLPYWCVYGNYEQMDDDSLISVKASWDSGDFVEGDVITYVGLGNKKVRVWSFPAQVNAGNSRALSFKVRSKGEMTHDTLYTLEGVADLILYVE